MLNAAVIGVGLMGKNHARVYFGLDNVNLVAIADPDKNKLGKLSKDYRCKAYTDYKKMLSEEKIDIVSIAVPTINHFEVSCNTLDKGINVLLEKPIAVSTAEGKNIISLAKKKNLKLMVGHIERFNPAVIELKKRINNNELGRVYKIDVNRIGPYPGRIRDVGVVIDLAVHDIDIIRYITGSEVKRLYAETEKKINSKYEDMLSGLLRFENGIICNMNINWLTPTKIRKLYITGERGMFVVNYLKQELIFYENAEVTNNLDYADIMRGVSEGRMIKFAINKKEPLLAEIEHFVNCINENKEPLISGEDGLTAIKIADMLLKSSSERRAI
ncbi:Gfo/Idh/MocA family oxidoreductase [Candidatus Woesearchaeota archaeon]|nr:Gfo/Idh/MocA family oxidoreductase [Candidatus Woesearchaeota archaeon]